jgi:hypothetical protein
MSLFVHLVSNVPTFLDDYDLGNMIEEQLMQAQNLPMDEFGVKPKICFIARKSTCSIAF